MINKEILLKKITSIDEAKAFIKELNDKCSLYHPDDDPFEVYNEKGRVFTDYEANFIIERIDECFELDNSEWAPSEDIYGYILDNFIY